ncbi:MAG: transporter substrate-binding domain-containing protein [Burkholderiales bacterium]|nr:transporter substrate-binding domain-containing protein [Burkholderiales bacterium]
MLWVAAGVWAHAEEVLLATLEWPPYVGAQLPISGGSTAILRAALAAEGITVKLDFLPWQRAVQLGTYDHRYAGYFPAYAGAERDAKSIRSDPIGSSPLGFAELLANPINWHTLDDLQGKRIGVVAGYVNTDDLDRRLREGLLVADAAPSDELNLVKLLARRVDTAVIDRHVFDYLLQTTPTLKNRARQLSFSHTLLDDKKLYVYCQRTPEGERLCAKLNEGLARINLEEVFRSTLH